MSESIGAESRAEPVGNVSAGVTPMRVPAITFMASLVSLFSSYALNDLVSPAGNPGVERAVVPADVFVYTFETFAFVLAASGVTAVIMSASATKQLLSGYIAIAFMWITVVYFSFITMGRQEQLELFRADRDDLLMAGRLPGWEGFYSAGFLFFGTGIAFFSWTLLKARLTNRVASIAGLLLGTVLAAAGYARLILGRDGFPDEFLTPFALVMLWLFVLGILFYRKNAPG